jgi:hypothetical protein
LPNPYTLEDLGGLHGGDVLKGFLSRGHNDDGSPISSSSGMRGTLAAGLAIGATSLTTDSALDVAAGASFVAIGARTTHCEVRRVTAVSGGTLTLDSGTSTGGGALAAAHSGGESVFVLPGTLIPPEWFGCKANDSTFDSYAGLQQFFNDSALTGAFYGLDGQRARYYSSRPHCFYDGNKMRDIVFTTHANMGSGGGNFDPTLGRDAAGLPNQFHGILAGQFGTVSSVDTAANTVTLSTGAGSSANDTITFYPAPGATLPGGIEEGRCYFLKTFASGNLVVTFAQDEGGTAVDITSAGSGTIYFYSLGLARRDWFNVRWEGNGIRGLNPVRMDTQQPDRAIGFRVLGYPGPQGTVWTGQQGECFGFQITNCYRGLNAKSLEFAYSLGNNFESCDILMEISLASYEATASPDIELYGAHFEAPCLYSAQVQSVTKSGTVSGGTYTLSFKGETTGALNWNDNAATIQAALEALTSIAVGDITVTDVTGGASAGGYTKIDFRTANGQYAWKQMKTNVSEQITVAVGSLTGGGSYVMNYTNPDGRGISVVTAQAGPIGIFGGEFSPSTVTYPDGTRPDLLTIETTSGTDVGYLLLNVWSASTAGYAVNDKKTGQTISWDSAGLNRGRVAFACKGGSNNASATTQKAWYLLSKSTKHLTWEEVNGELRFMAGAKMRFDDAGPIITSGTGTPEGAVTAPISSVYHRTDGGAGTSLYVKESGTGNTGWVAK